MKEFRPEDWHFFNMNSPADLQAEYKNGQVKIKEYAPYRDGHMLVSASNFDLIEKIELYIEICKVEAEWQLVCILGMVATKTICR